MVHKGQLKCSSSGQPLKSQKPGRENKIILSGGEEEGLADTRNIELLNNSNKISHLTALILGALLCVKIIV